MPSLLTSLYEPRVAAVRGTFLKNSTLESILRESVETDRLELFFICFCALGVQMTAPVASWIDRAGQRCVDLGWRDLGRALRLHAGHEADHHLMLIEDTRILVQRRNTRLRSSLSASELLATPATAGVRRYVELHEQVITGNAPFAQLAIEYEIERLSVQYGGQVLHLVRRRLSDESLAGMSFLVEHVALDVGHTKFNAAELEKLLGESHESASVLAAAGAAALEAYAMFLSDCSSLADSLGAQANPAVHRASPLVQKGM